MWTIPKPRYAHGYNLSVDDEAEISVNIGGVRVTLHRDVLNRHPDSRLAELLNCSTRNHQVISALCDEYDPRKREFYFDRDPDAFKCIIDVYYFDEIHIKRGICPVCFILEMDFWKIEQSYLDECCRSYLSEKQDELAEIAHKVKQIVDQLDGDPSELRAQRCRKFLWRLMEKPESSAAARVITVASFLFVLVSSVVMCAGTIPELQVEDSEGNRVEHPTLDAIETACIVWFTAEYLLRLASSPDKLRFALSFMNVVDFLAVTPFYVLLILTSLGGSAVTELAHAQQAVQALRVLRVARVFKLARHSSGLQTLTRALRRSCAELGLLLVYMGVGVFVFSALGYTLEQSHPDTLFTSIPHSFWWAVITMTTVGYGDIYPKTTLGRCNAAASFLCGVIAIALPIHPIINNFVVFYNKQRVLETAAKHELELMELKSGERAAAAGTSGSAPDAGDALETSTSAARSETFTPITESSTRVRV